MQRKELSEIADMVIGHAAQYVTLAKLIYGGAATRREDDIPIVSTGPGTEDVKTLKDRAISSIKGQARRLDPENKDEGIKAYLADLEASDWSTIETFRAFLEINNSYTGVNEIIKEQKEAPRIKLY